MLWNSQLIKSLNYGKVHGSWEAEAVCIDTRKLKKGEIFVAFKGNAFDGHDFIDQALEKGATAVIINTLPNKYLGKKLNFWLVEDVAEALNILARFNRSRSRAKFIGVTGSIGKTSTKEALSLVFSKYGKTFASSGNYNNNLGLPISLASMPIDTEFAIFEMGMTGFGEISYLSSFVKPDLAIITQLAPVHIDLLRSMENIAKAKSEIFSSMNNKGIAIINHDSDLFEIQKEAAKKCNIKMIYSFGESEGSDAKLVDFYQENDLSKAQANIQNENISYTLKARGKHQAINMLAVLLAVKACKLDLNKAIKALSEFSSVAGRGKLEQVVYKGKEILLFDEAYNSGPASLKAALEVLSNYDKGKKWQRKVAILADMVGSIGSGELSIAEHKKVANYLQDDLIDKVITVGKLMKNLSDILPHDKKLAHYDNKDQLIKEIDKLISSNDIILIKGSNSTKIYELVTHLKGN
jgi:UDP-N-acetylmuramoyl-tripeptide--D-alanyl-D-alanine ligase